MIRHGESEDNLAGIYSRDEATLTKKGIEQIKVARENLKKFSYKKVYYSPLTRTTQTLEHLKLEGRPEWKIRELDFGNFAGKSYKQLEDEFPEEIKSWQEDMYGFKFPQGESVTYNYKAIKEFLEILLKRDEDVLLVTHAGVIRMVMSWVFDDIEWFYKFKVNNASINVVSIEDDYKYIKKLNYDANIPL